MWLAILRREFLFWSDTANLSKKWYMPRRLVRNAAARIIFHSALKVLGTGRPGVEAFATMGCPTDKLVSFPYFAPIQDSYRSPKEKSAENPTIIVSLGRLDNSSKGFDIGLQALARLKRLKGLSSFQYLICGVGPDLERIRNQVDELGLSENVRFLGWLEVAEVKQILDVAHILLHPARYEPYGVAVLEAMISGVVVIGSEATCAVQDRILNGENGFVHAVGDVNTIAEQLSLILTDRERLLRMGMAARRTAEEWPASRGVEIIKSAFRD
jgi:glycosyltransferase involved in cell wall biosynthesis